MRDKKTRNKTPKITRSDNFGQAKCHNIQSGFVRRTRVNGLGRFYTSCVISEGHLRAGLSWRAVVTPNADPR